MQQEPSGLNTIILAELFRKILKYIHPKRMQHILGAT